MTSSPRLFALAAALVACSPAGSQAPPVAVTGPVDDRARAVLERDAVRLVEFRRDLHRHPETSGNEVRTAHAVSVELRRLGLTDIRTGVGGHGVVALVRGRRPGPMVAYRADMDAVPSSAPDPVEFRSLTDGVRHICGHDIHTTIGIALAGIMQSLRDSLAGSVMFVFQPAEERATGANAMLAAGVFGNERPVAIYGLHTAPYEVGALATAPGPMMAGRDPFTVTLTGAGDHSVATNITLQALQQLATATPDQAFANQPFDFIALTLSPPQATPGRTTISGTVSVASATSRARAQSLVTAGLAALMPMGVTIQGTYQAKAVAGVTNDSTLTTRATAAIRARLGADAVRAVTGIVPAFSEDFGSFQERVPGVFYFLGVSNSARGWVGMPHSPGYVADEGAIAVGARAMAAVLLDRLASP
ncbi:MAG: amidohydrolase [Gemmatimonadetes bacterium]|nr:amidohydrolase [Gemmatimonadota bacterium]